MSCITEITALHEVPGRVRYFVPRIKSSPANAAALTEYLRKVPGIYHARSCHPLGTLTIYFDTAELDRDLLHEHIHGCGLPEEIVGKASLPLALAAPQRYRSAKQQPEAPVTTGRTNDLVMELVRQGLLAAVGRPSGSVGLGLSALKTLLAAARAH